jgi:small subunit ribosomal protein S1
MALTDKEHEEKLAEGKLTGEKHPGGGHPGGKRPEKAPRGGGGERPAKAAPRAPAGVSVEEAGAEVQSQLQEEYLKHLERLEVGRLVDGCVVQVTPSYVFVNIGYKSEGRIPLSEFEETPKEGDTVQAVLVSKEDQNGEVVLSREKAGMKIFWKNLRAAMQNRSGVDIVIEKIVRGGFDVNLGSGVHGFLPLSQTDLFRVEEPEKYVGMKAQAVVERIYADNKLNIVVSRRNWLTEEMDRKRNAFLAANGVGDDVTGVVKSTTSFGAFVDLGGFDGLLHIKDMSWGHADKAKDFVRKGQELRLKIVRVDEDGRRINLSLKHLTEDPWVHFEDKYHVNDIVKGKVTKLTDFGAFLEIETGIEGLVHISEFSWVKRFQKAKDFLQKGDTVECMILGYDIQAGKVSLGIRQATPNPWETIEERYPVGTRLTKKVTKVTNTAAFIELDDGIEGCLRAEDMSWTRKIEHLGSKIHAGDEIETVVIVVDRRARNIRLGIKQLTENPWRKFSAAYKPGDIVEGTVSAVAEFGIFVSVPGQDVEGLVHKSNLTMDRDEDPDEARKKYKVGDAVTATVLEILPDKQKLTFSVRDYQKKIQREEISRYTANEAGDTTHTLGDLLKSKSRDTGKREKESPEEPQEPEKEAP